MDRPGARLIDYKDSCVLMLPDSAGQLFYGIDKTRWVVARKGRCTLRGDTCASPPVNVFYYYRTIKEIHVPVTILAYDSADTAKFHQFNGYYRFSYVRVNEPLPDSVFGSGSAVLSGSGRRIPPGTAGLAATVSVDPAGRFIRNTSGGLRGAARVSTAAGPRFRVPVFAGRATIWRN